MSVIVADACPVIFLAKVARHRFRLTVELYQEALKQIRSTTERIGWQRGERKGRPKEIVIRNRRP